MNNKTIAILICSVILGACEADKGETLQASLNQTNTVDVVSDLNYGDSVIPFPNDLLFLDAMGSPPADGTLNIPLAGDPSDAPLIAMNALDGFSTSSPITTGFSGALDDTSLPAGVKLYEVTLAGPVVGVVDAALTYGVDFAASQSVNSDGTVTLAIVPLKPLKPKQSYMAVITDSLQSATGRPAGISGSYALTHGTTALVDGSGNSTTPLLDDTQAQQLEPIRQVTVAAETALNAFDGTASADIILSWRFTTQSIGDVLDWVRTELQDNITASAMFSPTAVDVTPGTAGSIHVGTLDVPYFLEKSTSSSDPTALDTSWQGAGGTNLTQFNTAVDFRTTETIPMIVVIPNPAGACSMPVDGWPVVIYQHGITRKRADVVAVADSLTASPACFAVVAIDLPLHGVTGLETDGSAPFKDLPVPERHFDLNLVTQDSSGSITATTPDMVIDSSGIHFINLTNLLTSRDNLRQAVSDLFALVDAINEGAVTDGSNTMDEEKIYFLGHSLGAIIGTTFLALEPDVRDAALANGGSAIAKILDGSASFGPTIAGGLAANGILKGTGDYEAFLVAAQTVIDSADPVNYSLDAPGYAPSAAVNRGLLFTTIAGDSVLGNPSDLTVPITVPDANDTTGTVPSLLAGANPQIGLLGLARVNSSQAGTDLMVTTGFTSGYHGSLIDPAVDALADGAVTLEMQTQIASFLASDGDALSVTNAGVLLAP